MKKLLLLFLLLQFNVISCQSQKELYLLFEKEKDKMYILNDELNTQNKFKIYTYNINVKGEFQEVYFDSETSAEKGISFEKNGNYETKLRQKIISIKKIKDYDIKNYNWLDKKINSLKIYHQDFLYKLYKKMYIVQIDTINQKATITEVDNVEIID